MALQTENNFSKCPTAVEELDVAEFLLYINALFNSKHKIGRKIIKGYQLQLNTNKVKLWHLGANYQ
jgi:hypothetical protein